MSFKFASRLFGLLAGSLVLSGVLSAASISGIFNLTGNVQVTGTEDVFGNTVIGDNQALTQLQLTGSFANMVPGQIAGIANLVGPANTPPGPVTPGTPFNLPNWITLPNGINLDATMLTLPNDPMCSGSVTSNCVAYSGSPIVLNQSTTVPYLTTATFTISGNAHYAGQTSYSPFVGILTATFPESLASVLGTFSSTGMIEDGFTGSFTVSPSTVTPEPASMALIGAGLLALGFFGKRKTAK